MVAGASSAARIFASWMRIVVAGTGAVGARAARQLHTLQGLDDLVLVDPDYRLVDAVAASVGSPARVAPWSENLLRGATVVVLALPTGTHRQLAEAALESGCHVVSAADDLDEVRRLLDLDAEAAERGRCVVVGAGFSPGLTCLLARHAAADFSEVDEIHVAKTGTGGPACARQHHRALGGEVLDWRDGLWARGRAGSGRELCWFPDPVGGLDCYRAALPDPLLLVGAFPSGTSRITSRVSASRRDRITARLPMLRPPHAEGQLGAVRVEVRGRRAAVTDTRVLGAIDRPGVAAGAVAAIAASWAATGQFRRSGAGGLGDLVAEPAPFLRQLGDRGVRSAVFVGAEAGP